MDDIAAVPVQVKAPLNDPEGDPESCDQPPANRPLFADDVDL